MTKPHPHLTGHASFEDRPAVIVWEVTRACSLACRHCRASAQPRRHSSELDLPEALNLLDQIEEIHPDLLILTGGDPMMRRDLLELIRGATRRGLRVALSPSATPRLLGMDFEILRSAGVSGISLSLDGVTRQRHDAFRGVAGTWDRTWACIQKAAAARLPVQINTTITRQNISDFDGFRALVEKINPRGWTVFLVVPTGRATLADLPDPEDVERMLRKLEAMSRDVHFLVRTTDAQHYRRIALQNGSRPQGAALPTNAGRGFLFISHTGKIYPSGFLPLQAGNVRHDRVLDIYRHHPLFRRLRNPTALGGKCGRCQFNRLCGGSRARAFGMTGDPFAEDPLCIYQPSKNAKHEATAHSPTAHSTTL